VAWRSALGAVKDMVQSKAKGTNGSCWHTPYNLPVE